MIINKDSQLHFVNIIDSPYKYEVRHWRNQEYVRSNMISSEIITKEQHEKYLDYLKTTKEQKIYIAMLDENPIAVMTFRHNLDEQKIVSGSYLIKEEYLGKGLGVILGYVRMEYIFSEMPEGTMRTFVMESNKKNLGLQRDFGCREIGKEEIVRDDGSKDNLVTLEMTKKEWEQKKSRIKRVMIRLLPIENIHWIKEEKV